MNVQQDLPFEGTVSWAPRILAGRASCTQWARLVLVRCPPPLLQGGTFQGWSLPPKAPQGELVCESQAWTPEALARGPATCSTSGRGGPESRVVGARPRPDSSPFLPLCLAAPLEYRCVFYYKYRTCPL